ncbi:protein kinase [Trypanosoma rangeli]|uniref:Protein kinase n=1 Tax=Trypanosoma rangeli TaxID=5698 RepID=A0A3R7M551_TRYRA|nr:protein kinase [Trypanosoma rangeli]RNF09200.1 protein kinase [Trypanosoma rangeli]|eukprot:RNF09200.1 protein kinase [Trypanosoma rangeli]
MDVDGTKEPTVRALCEDSCAERVLMHRGKHSRFYRLYWGKRDVWLGLKEEECLDPIATWRNLTTIQDFNSEFILHHYNICPDTQRDTLLRLLTELMDYALSDVIHCRRGRGHLTENQTKAIAFLTLHALVDLHDGIGMVHADISPSNILLRATGDLKLGDLSSAMPVNAAVNYFAGTVLYTAVEVLKDRQLASKPGSDIWALGVTLHECVNGRHPFADTSNDNFWEFLSLMETARQAERQPVCSPGLSQEFHDILCAMLRWDITQRPSARSLLEHIWFSQYSVTSAHQELCFMAY